MAKNLVAFVSYAHFDDKYDEGAITHLAGRLEGALRAFTGKRDLEVFFDRTAIAWGDAWRARIGVGLTESMILIPIVTPYYLSSEECRNELQEFLAMPEREHWLLPIYYREVTDLDTRDDALSRRVRVHQCEDWRELRTAGRASVKVRKAIEQLAKRIRDLLQTARLPEQSSLPVIPSETSFEYRAQATGAEAEGGDWVDYVLIARAAFDEEEYGLARALLLGALDRFPYEPEIILEIAVVDWYDGALDVAVTEFEQALAAGIDRITVLQGLGQARVESGDFERGIEELTAVIEHDPDHVSRAYARSTRALGFGGIGRFEKALEEFAAAERVTPDNAWLHFNRARVLDWQAGGKRELYPLPCSQLAATQPTETANGATTRLGDGMASMTTLVTGFEPFGGSRINSSELVVTALDALKDPGVITAVLPTSYRRAEARIGDLLHAHRPRTVLMLGLAEGAARMRFEQVAVNLDDCDAPDNDGEVRLRQRIVEGAPVGYWSSLQLDRMADTARDLSEDVLFSHDAGGYVCNHVFFTAAHLVATEFPGSRCGLVHLPAVQGSDERLSRFLDIVRIWIAEHHDQTRACSPSLPSVATADADG